MHRDFNTLLIPVESQVRELDGKLLLASIAAENNFNVIIGARASVHFHASKVKDAIYLAKSMRRFSSRMFKILHGLGHRIIALDEEALVRLPNEQYYTHRLSPITFNYIDHLLSWGDSDALTFEQYPYYQGQPIHRVGNPRIDILRPELRDYFAPEKNNLIEQYGNFVLINTNFGQINHFIPDVGNKELDRDKNFSAMHSDEFISQRFKHKKKLFDAFKSLVPYLASSFPDVHFILRPHPSESVNAWQVHLNKFNNVTVNNNGNVIPWIMAAKALISNGCTTSIEATVLGTPTLGYYPFTNDLIDDQLPKSLCDNCETHEQIADKLSTALSTEKTYNNKTNYLDAHISNLSGTLSSDKIINILDKNYHHSEYKKKKFLLTAPSIIHNNGRTLIKKVKSRNPSSRNSIEYHMHRFPHINEEFLYEKIHRLHSLTGRFKSVKIKTLNDDIFSITSP